ncbi:hypothetical protein SJAV_20300 [Sulfurisphaera javensis]|uniref:Thermopsin n=1 Tax=Sulfurisphaera javensis TaxID=2049879 RepID=A0AAT9GTJ3_9CREN
MKVPKGAKPEYLVYQCNEINFEGTLFTQKLPSVNDYLSYFSSVNVNSLIPNVNVNDNISFFFLGKVGFTNQPFILDIQLNNYNPFPVKVTGFLISPQTSYATNVSKIIIPPNGEVYVLLKVYFPGYSYSGSLTIDVLGNFSVPIYPFIESTGWLTKPYYLNNVLVINSSNASYWGQYIAWHYVPNSSIINVTIVVDQFPLHAQGTNPGIELFSFGVGNYTTDGDGGFYSLVVDFYDNQILYHSFNHQNGSEDDVCYNDLPQPNPNYPFTFSVIFMNNSGFVEIYEIGINGTYYQVDYTTQFPWQYISYIGIRGDINDIFYVSYFAVTSNGETTVYVT